MARPAGEINAGSMADIAFLLLIFWLVTTTMDVDAGLARLLPPMPPDPIDQKDEPKVNRRNIIEVRISKSDILYAAGAPMDLEVLKDRVKDFISNPTNDEHKPEKEIKQIEGLGAYPVSKAIISLQNDRGTSYEMYIKVQNELVKAYNELRDEFSMQQYGKKFASLSEDEQKVVKDVYAQRISEAEPRDIGGKKK